jgi:hypothetical protein
LALLVKDPNKTTQSVWMQRDVAGNLDRVQMLAATTGGLPAPGDL